MFLNIFKIPEGRSVLTQKVVWEGEQSAWLNCPDGLQCTAEIDRMQSQIAVHVVYSGAVVLECSRCLNTFLQQVSGDFHVILRDKTEDKKKNAEDEEPYSDYDYDETVENIDIRDAIYDDVMTALPMMPLCSETCPGIPVGGNGTAANEKSGKDNAADGVDERWAALKKLKERK